jgi:hypothetical protein
LSGLIALIALMLTGCATSHTVTHAPETYASLTDQANGRDVTIHLADGRRFDGRKLRLAPDTTRWQPAEASVVRRAPTMAVTHLHIDGPSARRQAVVRYGVLVGFGVGVWMRQDLPSQSTQAIAQRFGTYLLGPALGLVSYAGALLLFPDRTYTLHLPPPDPPHVVGLPVEGPRRY